MGDGDIYRQQNVGNTISCGRRPALATVDFVARDCVGDDRAPDLHEANLFDMAQKYADVISRDAIIDALPRSRSIG